MVSSAYVRTCSVIRDTYVRCLRCWPRSGDDLVAVDIILDFSETDKSFVAGRKWARGGCLQSLVRVISAGSHVHTVVEAVVDGVVLGVVLGVVEGVVERVVVEGLGHA